jgi:hypothetical protein
MSVNIAGSVAPTYDAAIPVPLDGEYANSAALQAMILPIANRAEYLRQIVEEDPLRFVEIREDFSAVNLLSPTGVQGDTTWQSNVGGSSWFNAVSDVAAQDEDHQGILKIQENSGSACIYKMPNSFPISRVQRAIVHVRLGAAGVPFTGFEFGFSAGTSATVNTTGVNAWTAQYDPAVGGNWLHRTGNAGGNTRTSVGSAVTFGAWNRIELYVESGNLFMQVNNGTPHQATLTLPVTSALLTPIIRFNGNSSSPQHNLDAVYYRFAVPNRGV